jgi:hypothetical protein
LNKKCQLVAGSDCINKYEIFNVETKHQGFLLYFMDNDPLGKIVEGRISEKATGGTEKLHSPFMRCPY